MQLISDKEEDQIARSFKAKRISAIKECERVSQKSGNAELKNMAAFERADVDNRMRRMPATTRAEMSELFK